MSKEKGKTGTGDQLGDKKQVAMNFVVDPDFRKEYRVFASQHDMTMVDILKESFRLYKNSKE